MSIRAASYNTFLSFVILGLLAGSAHATDCEKSPEERFFYPTKAALLEAASSGNASGPWLGAGGDPSEKGFPGSIKSILTTDYQIDVGKLHEDVYGRFCLEHGIVPRGRDLFSAMYSAVMKKIPANMQYEVGQIVHECSYNLPGQKLTPELEAAVKAEVDLAGAYGEALKKYAESTGVSNLTRDQIRIKEEQDREDQRRKPRTVMLGKHKKGCTPH